MWTEIKYGGHLCWAYLCPCSAHVAFMVFRFQYVPANQSFSYNSKVLSSRNNSLGELRLLYPRQRCVLFGVPHRSRHFLCLMFWFFLNLRKWKDNNEGTQAFGMGTFCVITITLSFCFPFLLLFLSFCWERGEGVGPEPDYFICQNKIKNEGNYETNVAIMSII